MTSKKSPVECLIIKTSALGDVIQSFAVIDYLHTMFASIAIDWVVEHPLQELVASHPYVRTVIAVDTEQWRKDFFLCPKEIGQAIKSLRHKQYDFVLDLQGNTKSAIVTMLCRAQKKIGFGAHSVAEWPNLLATNVRYDPPPEQNITQDYLSLAQKYCADSAPYNPKGILLDISGAAKKHNAELLSNAALQGKKFLVCPGSRWHNKQLPKETWKEFLQKIASVMPCSFLFVWGSDAERTEVEELHHAFTKQSIVVPRIGLPQLQNLMAQVDCVLAVDSMALHLSATTKTPSFSIFGASSADKYAPKYKNSMSLQGSCPYGLTFEKRCPHLRTCATGACIRDLSAESLFEEFSKICLV